jgi:dihydropyrimidinase
MLAIPAISLSRMRSSPASAEISQSPPDVEVIDATGKLIFPGFIDPHVHIHLPFMATFAKDTHATASVAALIGGTTTFIEMVLPFAQ